MSIETDCQSTIVADLGGSLSSILKAVRIKWVVGYGIPMSLAGTLPAWSDGHFRVDFFALNVVVILSAIALSITVDEYFDWRSGADRDYRQGVPFSSGGGAIPSRRVSPRSMLKLSLVCALIALAPGLFLSYVRGPLLLLLGLAAGFLAYSYTGWPFKLDYHGLGELNQFFSWGVIPVSSSYLVQTGTLNASILVLGVLIGLAKISQKFVRTIHHVKSDSIVGKRTFAWYAGPARLARYHLAFSIAPYIVVLGAVLSGVLSTRLLLVLALLPIAILISARLRKTFLDSDGMRALNKIGLGYIITFYILSGLAYALPI